jgi:hypothetical protein
VARFGRRGLPLAAALLTSALPVAAQQAPPPRPPIVLPTPATPDWAAAGKALLPGPGEAARLEGGEPLLDCGRDLPCRVRLRGVLGKNGGIAVEGTAFTW